MDYTAKTTIYGVTLRKCTFLKVGKYVGSGSWAVFLEDNVRWLFIGGCN